FGLYYPDGIQRDRARTSCAMAIIKQHTLWYATTVVRRMAAVMKYAGAPNGIYGSAGINVTAKKSLPPAREQGVIAFFVNALGMVQSVLRYILLPLMIVGVVLAFRAEWRTAALIMTTVAYYLVVGSLIHTHIRYGLPMQALLTIFAGLTFVRMQDLIARKFWRKETAYKDLSAIRARLPLTAALADTRSGFRDSRKGSSLSIGDSHRRL